MTKDITSPFGELFWYPDHSLWSSQLLGTSLKTSAELTFCYDSLFMDESSSLSSQRTTAQRIAFDKQVIERSYYLETRKLTSIGVSGRYRKTERKNAKMGQKWWD